MMQRFLIPNQKMPNGQSSDDDISGDLARMIIGQGPAQNVGQGIGQLMAGLSLGIDRRNAAFPPAPGGAQPSFMTGLRNFVTGGHNGGLF
ncbi:hypothetical protein [Shinella sp. G-2]|uniref:hypothetical protein n=1 Tax=Shinella sp. G-2 TaxID=3133141 RepID=UPI003CFC7EB6